MLNRKLSFGQLVNLSFGFFGVQIAYALQSANISRIFATLGADPHQLSFFWILPPLMGMIVQPLIGPDAHFLDNPQSYTITKKTVTPADSIDVTMAPGGGFAISFKPCK